MVQQRASKSILEWMRQVIRQSARKSVPDIEIRVPASEGEARIRRAEIDRVCPRIGRQRLQAM